MERKYCEAQLKLQTWEKVLKSEFFKSMINVQAGKIKRIKYKVIFF